LDVEDRDCLVVQVAAFEVVSKAHAVETGKRLNRIVTEFLRPIPAAIVIMDRLLDLIGGLRAFLIKINTDGHTRAIEKGR
jgi:hypothetical protein